MTLANLVLDDAQPEHADFDVIAALETMGIAHADIENTVIVPDAEYEALATLLKLQTSMELIATEAQAGYTDELRLQVLSLDGIEVFLDGDLAQEGFADKLNNILDKVAVAIVYAFGRFGDKVGTFWAQLLPTLRAARTALAKYEKDKLFSVAATTFDAEKFATTSARVDKYSNVAEYMKRAPELNRAMLDLAKNFSQDAVKATLKKIDALADDPVDTPALLIRLMARKLGGQGYTVANCQELCKQTLKAYDQLQNIGQEVGAAITSYHTRLEQLKKALDSKDDTEAKAARKDLAVWQVYYQRLIWWLDIQRSIFRYYSSHVARVASALDHAKK